MKPLVASFVVFLLVAEGIAISTAGVEDQSAFIFWTVPAAVLIAGASLGVSRLTRRWRPVPACSVLMIGGGLLGLLWTLWVTRLLGPWVGGFAVPILLCWIAAGASAGSAVWFLRNGTPVQATLGIVTVSAVLSMAVFLIPVVAKRTANDQQIVTFFFRYVPGKGDVTIEEQPSSWTHEEDLTDEEKAILAKRYPAGRLVLEARHSDGSGPQSRMIIVVEKPVDRGIQLARPDHATVFYFQAASRFDRFPRDVPLLDRSIALAVREYAWKGTEYVALNCQIDLGDGSAIGRDVMRWRKEDIEQTGERNRN